MPKDYLETRRPQPLDNFRCELSIVTTLYRSAPFIDEFYRRITAAATTVGRSYELVFVNDGSPDDSFQRVMQLADGDHHVRVVDLSRNFGHHAAILAGLRHARGNYIFSIDVDLEEQPEWLIEFWEDLHANCADLVYGVQITRSGSAMKRTTGAIFYNLFNLASDIQIPPNVCTVRLMRRSYVEAVTQFTEAHIFLAGLYSWAGFIQRPRYVQKIRRPTKSSYTPIRLLRLFVNAVTSFSGYPLTIIFVAGMCVALLALLYACGLVLVKLLRPQMIVSGFTSILVSLWFIAGAIISVLGLVGMYVGNIFTQAKGRPQYFVRGVYERASK